MWLVSWTGRECPGQLEQREEEAELLRQTSFSVVVIHTASLFLAHTTHYPDFSEGWAPLHHSGTQRLHHP